MLDPQLLRSEPEQVKLAMQRHGADLDVDALNALETRRKAIQVRTQRYKTNVTHALNPLALRKQMARISNLY